MRDLISYDLPTTKNLLDDVKIFFASKGIMLPKKSSVKLNPQSQSANADPTLWIKPFIIQPSEPAFYLDINSPDDLFAKNTELDEQLSTLQGELKIFLQNNSDLEETLKDKINTFATSHLTRAKIAVNRNLRKKFNFDIKSCTSIEELRDVAGQRYSEFFTKDFLERIMIPLYESIKQTPDEPAYLWTLGKVNSFLEDLGIMTVNISIGDVYDENSPYVPAAESNLEKYSTTNPNEKDTVREILRYAYAFQENKGAENRIIMDGEVIVMTYRAGGAK
ncbi:MAG: hypothetical protein IJS29_01780 [Selenomonadaceae bacterium]|nr:hypothetical protein [Selenomonadaceae bacterium]